MDADHGFPSRVKSDRLGMLLSDRHGCYYVIGMNVIERSPEVEHADSGLEGRAEPVYHSVRRPYLRQLKSEPFAYSHAWRSLNNIHADHVITSMPITQ
jgi:hypothetical protein